MNRREVLQSAAAGIFLTVLGWSVARAGGRGRLTMIYDERHDDACALAGYLRPHGAMTLPTRGDATELWYGGTLPRDGETIAGLTTWPDLVIARSRGREIGLRLAFGRRADDAGYEDHADPIVREPVRLFAEALTRIAAGGDAIETPGRSGHLVAWLLLPRVASPVVECTLPRQHPTMPWR